MKYLKIDDIIIGTYKYDDVTYFDIIKSGYGLAKVHEIYFSKEDNNIIKWKKYLIAACIHLQQSKSKNHKRKSMYHFGILL